MSVNPLRDPGSWDWIILAGKPLPGIPRIVGASDPRKWDVRAGYGTSGATTVFTGTDIKEFSIEIEMWDPDQVDYWNDTIVPILEDSRKGKTALDFYAPACSEPPINIRSIVVTDPTQLTVEDDGTITTSIKVMKYAKPKPAVGKPASSKKSTDQPTAQDAQDKEIAALTAQLKDLASQ